MPDSLVVETVEEESHQTMSCEMVFIRADYMAAVVLRSFGVSESREDGRSEKYQVRYETIEPDQEEQNALPGREPQKETTVGTRRVMVLIF